jgi:uncharacterized repeat protein (TIGR01451 family)
MSGIKAFRSRYLTINPIVLAATMAFVIAAAAPSPAGATAKLWLYPDSDDPRNGGHVVTEPAFTLNIENRGTGNGDNTAEDSVLLVAVNDPALVVDGSIALPGGTVYLDSTTVWDFGIPTFDCDGKTVPPHGVYPAYFVEFPIGDIAQNQIISAGVVINGLEGLRVHFDAKAMGWKQAGPNLRCYDVFNPSGHDVTMVFDEPGGSPCHEISIDKTAGATGVALGDPMDYVIVVENRGTCELTEVVLTEDLPTVPDAQGQPVPAFTVVAIDPPPTNQTPTSIEWVLGTLAPGDIVTATVSVVFDQPDAVGLEIENTACVTSFELPDPACASASVMVGESDGDEIGGPGFWCNQLRFAREGRPNAKFTTAELEAWLLEIFDQSAVFPELWPLVTLADAEELLCRPNQAETMADRLARHLLALRFNVVSERLPLDTELGDLCPGDEEPPPGMNQAMTVEQLIAAVEAELVAGAADEILEFWLEVVDFVNNARLPGPGGCDGEVVRRSGNRRHVTHRP